MLVWWWLHGHIHKIRQAANLICAFFTVVNYTSIKGKETKESLEPGLDLDFIHLPRMNSSLIQSWINLFFHTYEKH
jgi:hypothetical protein